MLVLELLSIAACAQTPTTWSDHSPHSEGNVRANGVRLQYLDWGGKGPPLIFIHGLGDNPHAFDDLAPAFTDRFHVIAYARRGHGGSDASPPYDVATLTEDLRGLMDTLGLAKAHLGGWSMGGTEMTAMAARYPERVRCLIYLDSYDLSDPYYLTAIRAAPLTLKDVPVTAMASLDAYRSYERSVEYPALEDMRRVEAYLRDSVVVRADGSLQWRTPQDVRDALFSVMVTDRRDYTAVHRRALAIYARSVFDSQVMDAQRRRDALAWEQEYWAPFRAKAIERMRQELAGVEIVTVPGTHKNFFLTARSEVVATMRRFLGKCSP